MTPSEFDDVVAVARSSVLFRAAGWLVRVWTLASEESVVVRTWRRHWMSIVASPAERRLQLGALTLGVALAGYSASLLVLPNYVTSGLPIAWGLLAAALTFLMVALPRGFVNAWQDKFGKSSRPESETRP